MIRLRTSQLTSGLVLGSDLVKDDIVLFEKFKVLDSKDIAFIQKYFDTCDILSLVELEPCILYDSSFSNKYINFLVNHFNFLFSSVLDNESEFKRLSDYIAKELSKNREVLFSLIRLRQNHKYTYEHSTNVALLCLEVGYTLELTDYELHNLVLGAILHDLGKLRISNSILDKPSKLSDAEFEIIKTHPDVGTRLANNLEGINPIISRIVREHHEKLDGTGYPDKLKSGSIHDLSKIVTVCDIFDAVTSKRSYHEASSYEKCAKILCDDVNNGKLDKDIVKSLLSKTVIYPLDTFVRLSNGVTGFVVVEDIDNNRPVVYDCVNKVYYDLRSRKDIGIVYAV